MRNFEFYLKQAEDCERQAETCAGETSRGNLLAEAVKWRRKSADALFGSAREEARTRRDAAVREALGMGSPSTRG